jgi:hypothetical protein
MTKLILLLLFTQLNFANGADFDVKRILGKWEAVNSKSKDTFAIEIISENDSIYINANGEQLEAFPIQPVELNTERVTYRRLMDFSSSLMETFVIRTAEFYDLKSKTVKWLAGGSMFRKISERPWKVDDKIREYYLLTRSK